MQIQIKFFGQLTEITHTHQMMLNDVTDSDELIRKLTEQFPALAAAKYVIAVDQQLIRINTELTSNCTVALLPPFSGG